MSSSDHVDEGVVHIDQRVVGSDEGHGRHVLAEGETEALLGLGERRLSGGERVVGHTRRVERQGRFADREHVGESELEFVDDFLEVAQTRRVKGVRTLVKDAHGVNVAVHAKRHGGGGAHVEAFGVAVPRRTTSRLGVEHRRTRGDRLGGRSVVGSGPLVVVGRRRYHGGLGRRGVGREPIPAHGDEELTELGQQLDSVSGDDGEAAYLAQQGRRAFVTPPIGAIEHRDDESADTPVVGANR